MCLGSPKGFRLVYSVYIHLARAQQYCYFLCADHGYHAGLQHEDCKLLKHMQLWTYLPPPIPMARGAG